MENGRPPENGDGEDENVRVTSLSTFRLNETPPLGANDEALAIRYAALLEEHADLDSAIRALEGQPHHDRLSVARLKKRKLLLKDQIQEIKDQMTPDIIA